MFVADVLRRTRHHGWVLSHEALVEKLTAVRDSGKVTNADIGRVLGLPSSRIAEVFARTRQIKVDEMKALVEHFGWEEQPEPPEAPNASTLEPILDALLPLAPSGRVTAQSRRALAEALSYGLGLLGAGSATPASEDAVKVAARAAASRFRETILAS